MRSGGVVIVLACVFWLFGPPAVAQTSSLGVKNRKAQLEKPPVKPPREKPTRRRNAVYEKYSWTMTAPRPPKTFRPHDLLTVVVRQRRKFEADGELNTQKKWDFKSELDAFVKVTGGGVGASGFRRGKPNINYKLDNRLRADGDTEREDKFTTRITAEIIDVKPNGLLVFQGRAVIQHDDELSTITITGYCRKSDVTADNTVLSTQVADLEIRVLNEGAVRAATTRGRISKLLDWLAPL